MEKTYGKAIKKAYELNLNKIEEGYLYSDFIVHADNHKEARFKMLEKVKYENIKLKYSDDDLSYINIPVKRCDRYDLYDFEGQQLAIWRINEILNGRERIRRLDELLNNESITHCYIQKGNYYCPNYCGYTASTIFAGVYTKKEAVSEAKACSDVSAVPINIAEHNAAIQDKVTDLQSRIIPS